MGGYIFDPPILNAVVHPRVPHRINSFHTFKHQWILLTSNIRITHKISICFVSYPTTVFSVVKDDVVAHVEEALSGNLRTSLVITVEDVVVDGDI